jgi:hypothetical protein
MRRRDFILIATSATAVWPFYVLAQSSAAGKRENRFGAVAEGVSAVSLAVTRAPPQLACLTKSCASLAKNDLIQTIRDSQGALVMQTFMGKRVVGIVLVQDKKCGASDFWIL